MIQAFNIYLIGVGGQGIGLLAETILRAIDYEGIPVKSVDTHGLAQRGGTVISQIRMGKDIYSPLIPPFSTHLILSLEIHEAYRALVNTGVPGGTLVCYDTSWQPLAVRKGEEKQLCSKDLEDLAHKMQTKIYLVKEKDLPDSRMQNIALLKLVAKNQLIPSVSIASYVKALEDLMSGPVLEKNKTMLLS